MEKVQLGDGCEIWVGTVKEELCPSEDQFEQLWALHPDEHSEIVIHGKKVKVPRWDQAFEKDYPFSNQIAKAASAPESLIGYLRWAQEVVDPRTNGLFVNWHDGAQSHYHGKHRDSVNGLVQGTSIITVSLGEERVFRLRSYPSGNPKHDFVMTSGSFIVIPWETNQNWTHEIPKFARYKGRRISVTMRAFE